MNFLRIALVVSPLALAALVGLGAACSSSPANDCSCPDALEAPVMIVVSCGGTAPEPVVTVSGACTLLPYGDGGFQLEPTASGACDIVATNVDGAKSSAVVTYKAQPMACGSDPTGCGYSWAVTGATDDTVTLGGSACTDAGSGDVSDAGDAAPE